MTTPEQQIIKKARIRAESYHSQALTPLRAYELALDDALTLFPNVDKGEIIEDVQRILKNFGGDYEETVDAVAFLIEWRLNSK